MKVHISLNVSNLEKSVEFYRSMLGSEPLKYFKRDEVAHTVESGGEKLGSGSAKSGYAKFDIANPPLNLALNEVGFVKGGSLSHLGLEVQDTEDVLDFKKRWTAEGLDTVDEMEVDCCYAKQDKTWVRDPDGNEWEAFVVLEDLNPETATESCECSNKVSEYVESAKSKVMSGCCG